MILWIYASVCLSEEVSFLCSSTRGSFLVG